jgi:Peptidase family M23/Transglycosylase SLT domain
MPESQKAIVTEAAQKYGIDPKILWGLYGTETSFGKNVSTSSAGAVGPFQFEPATAKGMGVNPYDFKSAAFGAARYLSQYKGRGVGGMLSAYNAGPAGGYQSGYVDTTLQNAKSYGSAPVAQATIKPIPNSLRTVGSIPNFNQAGYEKAQRAAVLGKLIASEGGSDNPIIASGLASTKEPSRAEFTTTGTVPKAEATASKLPSGKTVAYVNPLSGFTKGRTDQGVDASAAPGTPIKAIGNGRVLGVSSNWYKGQPYVSYELTDGPEKGKVVYVAEQITPAVKAGDQVQAGQAIGHYAPSGTGIETGFGTKIPGQTLAKATTGYSEGQETQAGKQFKRFVEGIR